MENVRTLKKVETATAAQGLRAIAKALEEGTLIEPPFALVVFGFHEQDPNIIVMPVGGRMPNVAETVGTLTMASGAVAFGEVDVPTELPIE